MKELLGDIALSLEHATIIAQAMVKVAAADGVHEREKEMIASFYQTCAREAGAEGSTLTTAPFDASEAARVLDTPGHIEALVKSCYLLALADHAISEKEAACIAEIAGALGVSADDQASWAKEAKLYLFRQFSGVSLFKDKAVAIGRKLGLDDATIEQALAS